MRSKVEYRRCGCGQLHGLRESCPACARAKRAELHSVGVGRSERHGCSYDNGAIAPHPERFCEPPAHRRAAALANTLQRSELSIACEAAEAFRKLTGKVPYAVATPNADRFMPVFRWHARLPMPNFLEPADVPVLLPRAHECRWHRCSPISGGWVFPTADDEQGIRFRLVGGEVSFDGLPVLDEATEYKPLTVSKAEMDRAMGRRVTVLSTPSKREPTLISEGAIRAASRSGKMAELRNAVKAALGRGDAVVVDTGPKFVIGQEWLDAQPPEPPAVGAEVDYATALADMQARPEARYRHSTHCAASNVLRVEQGKLMLAWSHAGWEYRWVECSNSLEANGLYKWQRLPDATAKPKAPEAGAEASHADAGGLVWPAIGKACSWEVAECHMRRDPQAMYRHEVRGEFSVKLCMAGGKLMWSVDGELWLKSKATGYDCQRGKRTRLA